MIEQEIDQRVGEVYGVRGEPNPLSPFPKGKGGHSTGAGYPRRAGKRPGTDSPPL